MEYQGPETLEPEPITRKQLKEKIKNYGTLFQGFKRLEAHTTIIGDAFISEGANGRFISQSKDNGSHSEYIRKSGIIKINEAGNWIEYQLIATAKDITKDDLAEYANKGFNCMFKRRKYVVIGELSVSPDGDYVLSHACLEKKDHPFVGTNLPVPDDRVIALVDFKTPAKGHRRRKTVWGVTSFA